MIVMAINGVLRDPISREVLPSGRVLYRALTEAHGVALMSDDDYTKDARWLSGHGLTDHNFLTASGIPRLEQISRVRQRGSIDFVVESNPASAADLLREGITVLFWAVPAYTVPSYAPGAKLVPTPWGSLIDEVERQRDLKEKDTRITQEIL